MTDLKLTLLQDGASQKWEGIVKFSGQIFGLDPDLKSAGHHVLKVEKRCASVQGLPKEHDVTTEAIMSNDSSNCDEVSKLIMGESQMQKLDYQTDQAMVKQMSTTKKCYMNGKQGHLSKDCWCKRQPSSNK